jgi:hypothetical protein
LRAKAFLALFFPSCPNSVLQLRSYGLQ